MRKNSDIHRLYKYAWGGLLKFTYVKMINKKEQNENEKIIYLDKNKFFFKNMFKIN
jgi:hypothetical protein